MFPIKEVLGADVSKWQDNNETPPMMDMQQAKDNGLEFIFIKATQGYAKDPDFYENWANAKKAGIPRGAYHFADAYNGSAHDQAKNFWNTIAFDEGELPLVLDFEARDNIGLSFIKYFLEYIKERSKYTPILYTGISVWNDLVGSAYADWVLEYPLWISHPDLTIDCPVRSIPELGVPSLPNVWKNNNVPALFWQFTYAGDGLYFGAESKSFDLNVFNGTRTDFKIEFPEVPDATPCDMYIRSLPNMSSDFLRVRNRAEIYPGDTLAVGRNVRMKLLTPYKIPGIGIDYFWHVEIDGFKGFVSAGTIWTERV